MEEGLRLLGDPPDRGLGPDHEVRLGVGPKPRLGEPQVDRLVQLPLELP